MKIAITGGNGFLAGYLERELEMLGINFVMLVRASGHHKNNCNYIETDYSAESLRKILCGKDSIVHLAGPRKVAQELSSYKDFFMLTKNLYEAAADIGISNIVCASSISVYSGTPPMMSIVFHSLITHTA